jgi:uncharacterized protein (TIGR02246 family)
MTKLCAFYERRVSTGAPQQDASRLRARALKGILLRTIISRLTCVILISALFVLSVSLEAAQVACCVATDKAQISALFDRWTTSLATLDADQVMDNYAKDAVLLPTAFNRPRTSLAEIREYFVEFLKNGLHGKIDRHIIRIGCKVAQDDGTYTFRFRDGQTLHARYTYVYEWVDGQWLIAHHQFFGNAQTRRHQVTRVRRA